MSGNKLTCKFPKLQASELLSFNAKITSQEAHEWGLVSAIYANSEFMEKSAARVNEIAQLPIKVVTRLGRIRELYKILLCIPSP